MIKRIRRKYRNDGIKSLAIGGVDYVASIIPFYWSFAPRWYCWLNESDIEHYNIPIDPYKIEWVDPEQIKLETNRDQPTKNKWMSFGTVMEGEWDRASSGNRTAFSNHALYEAMMNHFVDGVDWEDTDYIQSKLDLIEVGTYWHGCTSREELLSRCQHLDEIYTSMKQEGYRSQREILRGKRSMRGFRSASKNEIIVDIGRDGELLFVDGRNRLTIAKILDIDNVAVQFGVRHPQWMKTLIKHYKQESVLDHPDARELKE